MPIKKEGKKKDGLQKYRVRVNYTSNSGEHNQIGRIAYGLEEAKMLEYQLQTDVMTKNEASLTKITIDELYNEYIEVKQFEVRETTLLKCKEVFNNHILGKLRKARIDKLGAKELQNWKLTIERKPLSVTMKNNIYTQLRAMLNYAVRMDYIPKNPLVRVGNFKDSNYTKREMSFYLPEEFKKFIQVAKQSAMEYQISHNSFFEWNYYVFFNIAFYTGLRKGEIHGLRWSDIDGDYLSVKRSVAQKVKGKEDVETLPKNKSSIRTLQMPLPLIKILTDHKKRQMKLPNFNEEVRVLGDGRCIRDGSIQNRSTQYANIAGVKRIRIHDFRHSHASLLANMGINIQEVARRLGHSKIEITWNTYSHLYPKEEEKAVAVLNNI